MAWQGQRPRFSLGLGWFGSVSVGSGAALCLRVRFQVPSCYQFGRGALSAGEFIAPI